MPVTDPTSRRLLPLKHLRQLVSRSAAFQALTGLSPASAALARVHYAQVKPEDVTKPFCIVGVHEDRPTQERDTLTSTRTEGQVVLRFLDDITETDDVDKKLFTLGDAVSDICDEIFNDATGAYGFRLMNGGEVSDPMLSGEEENRSRGFYVYVEAVFSYWD